MSTTTIRRIIAIVVLLFTCTQLALSAETLGVKGNRIVFDGKRGEILYRDRGNLDGDRAQETVFAMLPDGEREPLIIVAHQSNQTWSVITTKRDGYCSLRTDVTDVNGDGRDEIVARGISADGHGWCSIYALKNGNLVSLGDFNDTKLRDLNQDGIPEILSISMISFAYVGDHWLTIYKWNGSGYTDVSRRFPRQYDAVIRDLKRTLYELRYTEVYGHRHELPSDSDVLDDVYNYLGQAYEYRGQPDKARVQYAIAQRLDRMNE